MKYVVTGGAGFIGREVVRQLLSAGHSVSIYDDFSFGREANIKEFARHPQLQVTKGKVEDFTALHACVLSFRPDVVIHLAALHFIPYCNRHPLQTIRINVEGTYSVFDSCEQAGVSKVVMASTGAIYPSDENELLESGAAQPVDVYGCSKHLDEGIAEYFARRGRTRVMTIRFFNCYGPYETNEHLIPEIIKQLKQQPYLELGNLKTKRDYIYVADMARGIILLSQTGRAKPYEGVNLGTGLEYAGEELGHSIGRNLGREIEIRVDQARFRPSDKMHQKASTRRLRELTDWTPQIGIEEGLRLLLQHEGMMS